MTTNHKPATPLPSRIRATPQANDAEVKRRAAAYPRLVEALRGMTEYDHAKPGDPFGAARALLRELGEAE